LPFKCNLQRYNPDPSAPRTMRGDKIDRAATKAISPQKEGFARGGSPDSPFNVVNGGALSDVTTFTEVGLSNSLEAPGDPTLEPIK
jgi:hypothetical protein